MARPDVIVVGAGSAGCLLADRLSADGSTRVLLVESGGTVTDPDMRRPDRWPIILGRDYDWDYRTTPQPGLAGRSLEWARGRGLGGSSLLNAMAHMRGCRSDFEAWAEATGDPSWGWDGLLPSFERVERASGAGEGARDGTAGRGAMPVLHPDASLSSPLVLDYVAAWQSLGVPGIADHSGGEMVGATPNSVTIERGERVTTADAFLGAAADRANLEILSGATVHEFELHGDRVVGVRLERDGSVETVHADRVVLAAGSIGSPLLLMRSGIGDPAVLERAGVRVHTASEQIGRNLHDHLLAGNLYRARRAIEPSRLQLSESMTYLRVDDRTAGSGSPDIVVGCVVGPSTSEVFADAVPAEPSFTLLFGVTHPTSRGTLAITGPSVSDAPAIDPRYLSTEHDRARFRDALEHARLVSTASPLADWIDQEVLPGATPTQDDVDAYVARAAITHHHPVGTLRMGAADDAPVTPDLELRGVRGLSVVDASVIPSITAGPVHAAVLAIADRWATRAVASGDMR